MASNGTIIKSGRRPQKHGLIQVRIAGRLYDAVYSSTCRVCNHPARMEIEDRIVHGQPYPAIVEQYSETEYVHADGKKITLPTLTWTQVFRHFKDGHLPVELAALRSIVDERAKELGQQYEQQTSALVDGYAYAKQVVYKAQQGLASGELKPSLSDGIAAAKLIQDMEAAASGSVDHEAWSEAMLIYFETAQQFMPPDMWEHFVGSLRANPILRAIIHRLQGGDSEEEPIDAEVVEENP